MDYEPKQQTIFVVEIGNVDLYFDNLQKASEFFAKIVEAPFMKIEREGWNGDYFVTDKKEKVSMKTETINLYPNQEAVEFAKAKNKK